MMAGTFKNKEHDVMTEQDDILGPSPEETAKAFEGEITQPQAALSPTELTQKPMTIRDTTATNFLDPNLYIQLKALANDFIRSGAIPTVWQTAEQVLVGLQTGAEMGMKPMEAMNSLYPVNGAINVWGKATIRRLSEHGWKIKYSNETQESCTATVTKGRERYTETFEFADAEASGYVYQKNKYNGQNEIKLGWKPGMNRRKKLRYGVISLIISTYIPDVLGSAMGIVEVSDDYDLGANKNPAQLVDKVDDRKAKMLAAEAKHKELNSKPFKPAAISNED